ncbi:maleylacetoacetate isomerase [Kordiimonas aestuarii]|uniref:maleylacetoacetate isomerase n=1 Tax=Kordiimonas aestuarii TaxID=1005925 RepID=UPI0021D12CCC|nr:maleylacetoacetate isomerase [Kordiimonas aestuarii]
MRTLFGYFRSSAAYRVRIALALKGLEYKYEAVNLVPGVSEQKSDAYRRLNPQGRVPYFVDGEVKLSQSPAILEYLDEVYPATKLLPEGAVDRAYVRQLSSLIACDIHPLNNLSVLQKLKAEFGADDAATKKWYGDWIVEGFTALEKIVSASPHTGKFCFGDKPGMADIYLAPQMWNARRFDVDTSTFPTLVRIDAACNKLEPFIAAAPENQPDTPKS